MRGANFLNYIAGNPIRCPLPANILDITRLLLRYGARDASSRPTYTTGLLLIRKQASEVGVALSLVDLMVEAGAPFNIRENMALKMDLRYAALGRLDLFQRLLNKDADVKTDPL